MIAAHTSLMATTNTAAALATECVTINGVTYQVTKAITPATASPAQRDMMLAHGKSRLLFLRRLKGHVTYHVAEYQAANGARAYSDVISMGAWA
jgi:hypothetical protein